MANKLSETLSIINHVREKTDVVVLFYSSGGKDSIVLLDMVATRFKKVYCCFMYLVEDMEHIKPYLAWTKKYPNVEVRQYPHAIRSVVEAQGFFKDQDEGIKEKKISDEERRIMKDCDVKYAFHGMKGFDGFMKRMRLKMWKPYYISPSNICYPLALWTNKEVLRYIKFNNLIQPLAYDPKSISQGLGLNIDCFLFLKEKYPNDLKKIFKEFPYAEHVLFDYERKQNQTV